MPWPSRPACHNNSSPALFFNEHSSAPSALMVAEIPSPLSVCFIFLLVSHADQLTSALLEFVQIIMVAFKQAGDIAADEAHTRHEFDVLMH